MNKLIFAFIFAILMCSVVSATEWDNIYIYDENTRTATIINALGFGNEIAKVKLLSDYNVYVMQGYDRKVAEFEIDLKEDYSYRDAFNGFEIIDLYKLKETNRNIKLKYKVVTGQVEVPIYKDVCSETGELNENGTNKKLCSKEQIGTDYSNIIEWKVFNENELQAGKYTIGVFADVFPKDSIEWIPTLFGSNTRITEWATWTETMNIGLVAGYNFEETTGNLIDIVNGKYNGTLSSSGIIRGVTGIVGNSYNFTNSSLGYINLTLELSSAIANKSAMSYSVWAYFLDESIGQKTIIGNGESDGDLGFMLRKGAVADDDIDSYFYTQPSSGTGGTGITQTYSGGYPTNKWMHFVVVYNGTGVKFYVNNTKVDDDNMVNGVFNSTELFVMGATHETIYKSYMDGRIDELYIWNRSLTEIEVSDLWNNGMGITYTGGGGGAIPLINLNKPLDNEFFILFPVNISFNCSASSSLEIINISLYINGVLNITQNGTGTNFTELFLNRTFLTSGNYNWSCSASSSDGYGMSSLNSFYIYGLPNLTITTGNCSNSPALNFTLYNEENLTLINGEFDYIFRYGVGSNNSNYENYGKISGTNSFSVCYNSTIADSWLLGYGEIQYRSEGYVDRRYYLYSNTNLTHTTNTISLYDLLSASQTSFRFIVKSSTLIPYENVYASLIRWYPNLNSYNVVDITRTDETGSGVFHVKSEDVDYRISVNYQNGTLIYLSEPIRMVCLESPCTYTLKVPEGTSDYTSFDSIIYTFAFNKTTNIWSFVFSDSSQKTSRMTMNISLIDSENLNKYVICSSTTTGYVGAITCNTTGYSGNLEGNIYREASAGRTLASKIVLVGESIFTNKFILWMTTLIAIPLMLFLAMTSPISAIIGGVIALIPALYFGAINIVIIGGLALIGGIIFYVLSKT